jgi:hypothetical protein
MNPAVVTLIIGLLSLAAQEAPVVAPKIKEALDSLRGVDVQDITPEELNSRIDQAIARLPEWN